MNKEYGTLSTKFYEMSKPVGMSIDGDIEYYSDKLQNIKGKILEAGVGTGRVLIPLLKKGLDVDGIDSSPEMLEQCKLNLSKHQLSAQLFQQDITQLSLETKYDAIIMPAGSFCLLEKNNALQTLTLFRGHLKSGGKVIIDIETLPDYNPSEQNIRSVSLNESEKIVLTTTSDSIDFKTQKIKHVNKYELYKNDKVIKTEIADFVIHWYDPYEFEELLKRAGFKFISSQVGFGVNNNSSGITFIATI